MTAFSRPRQHGCLASTLPLLVLFLGGLESATVLGQRPPQGPMSSVRTTPEELGYELFWQDEFAGKELDSSKWEVRGIGPRALDRKSVV